MLAELVNRLLVVLALVIIPVGFSNAQESPENPCDSPYRIYFGNGIANTETDWVNSLDQIHSMIGDQYHGMPVTYANAINPSKGILVDLRVVFAQKISEDPSLTWSILVSVYLGLTSGLDASVVSSTQVAISDVERNAEQVLIQQYQSQVQGSYVDPQVVQYVGSFTDDIVNHARRVLLVGHSQGTLYANSAYSVLYQNPAIKPNNFEVVGVAEIANSVAGGGAYVTSDNDVYVSALRTMIQPAVLPANVDIPFHTSDIAGHSFLNSYVNADYSSRSAVQTMIRGAMSTLEEPSSSYDYKVQLDVMRWATDAAATDYGSVWPTRFCDLNSPVCVYGIPATYHYLRDAAGNAYDPDVSPSFNGVAAAALTRLVPFAPEANDPDSALSRLVTAMWPRLTAVDFCQGVDGCADQSTWSSGSWDYDPQMNISPMPPSHAYDDFDLTSWYPIATFPTPEEVETTKLLGPLATSIAELQGKVSYESGIDSVLDYSAYGLGYFVVSSQRLRICKNLQTS